MGDVGDEIALGLFHGFELGDVVEHDDDAAEGHGRDADFEYRAGVDGGGAAVGGQAGVERGADTGEHVGVANCLYQRGADAGTGDGKQPAHGRVGPLDATGGVERDECVGHAVEQDLEVAAAVGGLGDAAVVGFGNRAQDASGAVELGPTGGGGGVAREAGGGLAHGSRAPPREECCGEQAGRDFSPEDGDGAPDDGERGEGQRDAEGEGEEEAAFEARHTCGR